MTWFVVERKGLDIACVVDRIPDRGDQIIAAAETADEAWELFDQHEKRRHRREAQRDGVLFALLIALLLFGGSLVNDAPPDKPHLAPNITPSTTRLPDSGPTP